MAANFYKELLFLLPNLDMELKSHVLRIFTSLKPLPNSFFRDLKSKNIFKILLRNNVASQHFGIVALTLAITEENTIELLGFVKIIREVFKYHTDESCRFAYYEFLLALKQTETGKESLDVEILGGCSDSFEKIRHIVNEFISTKMLSSDWETRLIESIRSVFIR